MAKAGDVLADFKAKSLTPNVGQAKPVTSRVLLNRKEIVIVLPDGECSIEIARITNISKLDVPDGILTFVDDAISISYNCHASGSTKQVLIGGSPDTITKFSLTLYKLIFNTIGVCIHPFKRGGRVTDAVEKEVKITVTEDGVKLLNGGEMVIPPEIVIGVEFTAREIAGKRQPALVVDQFRNGTVKTTVLSLPNQTQLGILAEYLRYEYEKTRRDLDGSEISAAEKQVLMSVYSTTGDDSTDTTGIVRSMSAGVVSSMVDKGFVTKDDGISLTHRGFVAIDEHLEDIN